MFVEWWSKRYLVWLCARRLPSEIGQRGLRAQTMMQRHRVAAHFGGKLLVQRIDVGKMRPCLIGQLRMLSGDDIKLLRKDVAQLAQALRIVYIR